jgi:outer membrane lipoprotein-sorting protein
MKYLRTVSTQRLIGILAGLVVAVGGGTAIAVAAAGNGPVPPREQLAQAIHQALGAGPVTGISARIDWTNNLIDSTDIQGPTDPILQGGSGRLWLSMAPGQHRLRIELQSDNGDAQVVVNNGSWWVYDPASNTAYEGTLPAGMFSSDKADAAHAHAGARALPTLAKIQSDINKVAQHVDLSGAIPSDVAGQATYTLQVSPKHDGGLLGDAQLAWDAVRGIPLRFAIYAHGSATPVLELKATDISYGPVPASDFNIAPPSGATVDKVSTASVHVAAARMDRKRSNALRELRHDKAVSGVAAVSRRVPFNLVAPSVLAGVGLPRRSVSLLDLGGKSGALVMYGQNLCGVAVLEQAAGASAASANGGGGHHGLNLPSVSINGITGQELDTALGTMIRFTRGGVAYTVIGSVQPAAAEAAARGL